MKAWKGCIWRGIRTGKCLKGYDNHTCRIWHRLICRINGTYQGVRIEL